MAAPSHTHQDAPLCIMLPPDLHLAVLRQSLLANIVTFLIRSGVR